MLKFAFKDLYRRDMSGESTLNIEYSPDRKKKITVSSLDNDLSSDDDLPKISFQSKKKIILDDKKSNSTKMFSEEGQALNSKHSRKMPYSRNDYLSDSSDIENDVEIVETLSLKDRLLGKQCISSIIDNNNIKSHQMSNNYKSIETHDYQTDGNVIDVDEPCAFEEQIETASNFCNFKSTESIERTSEYVGVVKSVNTSVSESCVPEITKATKTTKQKRTTEEMEEKKRQAQVSSLDNDLSSDDDLPKISFQSKKKIILDDKKSNSTKMFSEEGQALNSKHSRKMPYSRNDYLSDSSDIENDVEIVETLSLKDRLLGKQCISSIIDNNNIKSHQMCNNYKSIETHYYQTNGNVIDVNEPCAFKEQIETASNFCNFKSTESIERTSEYVGVVKSFNTSVSESCVPEVAKATKTTKQKRTTEEMEEKKRQAQLRKDATEKRKLEREKIQEEKKRNVQIRKLEGERKKQMGEWNQSLEFMKIVLDPHIINDCGLGAAIFKAGDELKVPCVTEEHGLPFTITWKRTVTEWIEDGSQVETVKKEVLEDEVLTVIPISDFLQMVENSKQEQIEGKTTLRQYLQIVQQRQPGTSITPVVIGLDKYFRELKCVQQRQHREAVLSTGQSLEITKKKKNFNTIVSRIDIEEACTEAQILTGCVVQQLETPEDITDLLKTYTKAVAEKPAKKDRLNYVFSFDEDGLSGVKIDKSGHGLLKVWKQQLLQFKNVSPDIAEAIISEYPSPRLLMKAYSRCTTLDEGVKVLENIVVRRGAGVLETTRRVGKEMSGRFYLYFNNTDPTFILK